MDEFFSWQMLATFAGATAATQESNPEAANTMAQLPIGAGASVRGDGGNRRLYRVDILGNPAAECGAGKHGEQRRICGCQACGGRQGQNRIDRKRAPGVCIAPDCVDSTIWRDAYSGGFLSDLLKLLYNIIIIEKKTEV